MQAARLCIAGKNRIAVMALDFAIQQDIDVLVCPVASDDGNQDFQPSLLAAANAQGVPVTSLSDCLLQKDTVFLSLQFDQLVDPTAFSSNRVFNLHFSLLPEYKGCHSSSLPILHGKQETGVTLHEIDQGIDTGPVIDFISFPIKPSHTARSLYESYQDAAFDLYTRNLSKLLDGTYSSSPQVAEGSTYFPCSSMADIPTEINFRQTANQVVNFVRALYFPRFQTATFLEQSVRFAEATNERSNHPVGAHRMVSKKTFQVSTVDYDVLLVLAP